MTHYCIDLETLATTPDAHVLSIGVAWWAEGAAEVGGSFGCQVSDYQPDRRIDPSTVRWWLQQSDEARARFSGDNGTALHRVVGRLKKRLADAKGVWTNDPSFDAAVLFHAARQWGIEAPWPYWLNRCVRTAKAALPAEEVRRIYADRKGAAHSAESDAVTQAQLVIAYQRRLGGSRAD